jgi:hypothetical protein
MGISDDWSYIRSAQLLAETGHIHYVGWAAAMVGWQLYLAAACIKLVGFSFTAARLPTLLIGVVTAYLLQRTLVRFGISERNALLGTLTFVLSPLFLMLSVTMMTDVPAFFSVLVCIYGCVRALQTQVDREAVLWLVFAVGGNVICGTSRQIAWLGVLVVVPCTLWLLRRRRIVLLYCVPVAVLGYVSVFALLHWFNVQPYALPEPISLAPFHIWAWKLVAGWYVKAARAMALFLFPVCIPFVAEFRRFSIKRLGAMAILCIGFVGLVYALGGIAEVRSLSYPFVSDWVGPHALYDKTCLMSSPPILLSFWMLKVLSATAVLGLLCVGTTVFFVRPRAHGGGRLPAVLSLNWYQAGILLGPLGLVYFLLLSARGTTFVYDRYLFTPLFVALVCLAMYSQRRLEGRWETAAFAAVGVMAFYGVISTHNMFALNRARVRLAKEVFASGLSASDVDLGWEMNGWYELQIGAYLNNPLIVRPAGAYRASVDPHWSGCHEQSPFGLFPHLAPRYGIAFSPDLCEGPAAFAPVTYSTWPLRQPTTLYVVRYAPPFRPESDYEVTANRQ